MAKMRRNIYRAVIAGGLLALSMSIGGCAAQSAKKAEDTAKSETSAKAKASAAEQEETTAPEEAKTDPTKPESAPEIKSLGDSFYYGRVEIEGEVYQIPSPVSEFLSAGWEISGEEDELQPNEMITLLLTRDGFELKTTATNYEDGPRPPEECVLTEAVVTAAEDGDQSIPNLMAPRGIQLGMTEEELLSALEGSGYRTWENQAKPNYYVTGLYHGGGYNFLFRDGHLAEIDVNYPLTRSQWELEEKLRKFQQEHTESADATPALPDDLFSFQIDYGGVLLSLPCTAKDLETAGWMCQDSQLNLKPNETKRLYFHNLEKGRMICNVINKSSAEKPIADCLVTNLGTELSTIEYAGVWLKLPGEIQIFQSTVEDVIEAYGQPSSLEEQETMILMVYNQPGNGMTGRAMLSFRPDDKKLLDVTLDVGYKAR